MKKPPANRTECIHLINHCLSGISITELTDLQKDRLARHYLECRECRKAVMEFYAETPCTPEQCDVGIREGNRSWNRIMGELN